MRPSSRLLAAAAVAVTALLLPAQAGATPSSLGPQLRESDSQLASTLSCPSVFRGTHQPVLLVHATTETGQRNWSSNYLRVLPKLGYDVCTVELVDKARGDIQSSSERVVYAIRSIAERSHSRVDVIGHSQGPLEVRWAILWWPDIRSLVGDLVGIAAPYHGWRETDLYCSPDCVPALWQMRMGSRFMAMLNGGAETPGGVDYTSVYTITDELVQPYQTADLKGGANIAVQDICPGRPVEHIQMVFDAVVFATVMDALTHPGPADPRRIDRSVCTQGTMPGVDNSDLVAGEADFWSYGPGALGEHHVPQEPPLAAYAH
jgi:hypothetical protein